MKRGPKLTPEQKRRFKDESLCNHCGGCCYLSFEVDDETVIVPELPCRNLYFNDAGESRCRIYKTRLETDFCHKVSTRTVKWGLFPNECPYVEGIKGYKGKIWLHERPEMRRRILEEFGDIGRPDYIRARDWIRFFGAYRDEEE